MTCYMEIVAPQRSFRASPGDSFGVFTFLRKLLDFTARPSPEINRETELQAAAR